MNKRTILWICLSLGTFFCLGLAFGPCHEYRTIDQVFDNPLSHFKVEVTSVGGNGGSGTVADPYHYSQGSLMITFNASAHDHHGNLMESFEGDVGVKITPGQLDNPNQRIPFTKGRTYNQIAMASKLYGRVVLWLEDVHCMNGGNEIDCY